MVEYIIRRVIQAVLVLVLVTMLVFLAMRLLPGDPVVLFANQQQTREISAEEMAALRHRFGLDKSLVEQYYDWISNTIRGNLGSSLNNGTVVAKELSLRIPITFHIGALAFIISLIIGIPAGVICAIRRGRWIDTVVTILSNIGITIPIFWLGILMIYLFALYLGWLPVFGYTSPFDDFWKSTQQIIMPVFCLAVFPIASLSRQTRSNMLEVMRQDYIRTAWSKGLMERMVIVKHALKNSFIPVLTLAGIIVSSIFGGSVLVETVFSIPGMGRLIVFSILNQDYPYVQAIALIIAVTVVASNLAVDIAYGWLDPRIRYK
jgi:peptide/nickel transport system permease protein